MSRLECIAQYRKDSEGTKANKFLRIDKEGDAIVRKFNHRNEISRWSIYSIQNLIEAIKPIAKLEFIYE